MDNLDDADDWKSIFTNWNWNPKALAMHPLTILYNADVEVVLGTDGQGVEITKIRYEYLQAFQMLLKTQLLKKQSLTDQFLKIVKDNVTAQFIR